MNVDPLDSKLENPEDRARLARVFEQGLDKVVGYALPLRREYYTDGTSDWVSGAWFFRPEHMYLIPGDSPMGFRLPLDSIPWVKESEYPHLYEQDPMAERGPLPRPRGAVQAAAMSLERRVPERRTRSESWTVLGGGRLGAPRARMLITRFAAGARANRRPG